MAIYKRDPIVDTERLKVMRISPSSINTFRGCNRKWYYEYVEALTSEQSIPLVRGSVVHYVLEYVFNTRWFPSGEAFRPAIMKKANDLFEANWAEEFTGHEFDAVEVDRAKVGSKKMVEKFFTRYCDQIQDGIQAGDLQDESQGYYFTRPKFKELWIDDEFKTDFKGKRLKDGEGNNIPIEDSLHVGGFIDSVLKNFENEYILIDYKTSKKYKNVMSPEYILQLSIYAYLWQKQRGVMPELVAVNYLKYDESFYKLVTPSMIKSATDKIKEMRMNITSNGLDEKQYPAHETKLCNWCSHQTRCATTELALKEEQLK